MATAPATTASCWPWTGPSCADASPDAVLRAKLYIRLGCAEEAKKLPGYVEKTNKDLPFPYHIARVEEPEIEKRPEPTRDDYVIGVRPEFIRIDPNGAIEGEVFSAMPTGMETTLKIRVGAYLLTAVVFGGVDYPVDSTVCFAFSGRAILFDREQGGKNVAEGTMELM